MIKYNSFIYNISKVENWLEEYRRQGYRLIRVNSMIGRYEFQFEEDPASIPKVKLDFRVFTKNDEFQNYLSLFNDGGWKHIAGTKSGGVQYFEQHSPDAAEEIFSDTESKAGRYKRISDLWLLLFLTYLPIAVTFQIMGFFDFSRIFPLRDLYFTPGLWEREGAAFWKAFLFETPFALGRGFGGLLFLFLVLMYAWFGARALYYYRKERHG